MGGHGRQATGKVAINLKFGAVSSMSLDYSVGTTKDNCNSQ